MVTVSCGQHGCCVEHMNCMVDVLGLSTEWLPCRSYKPRGRRVGRTDCVVAMSSVWTVWSPCHTYGVVAESSVRTNWLPHHAYGPHGHGVARTDRVVDVLGVQTELSPGPTDEVVAESCGWSGRRVMRTDWLPCRSYKLRGHQVVHTNHVVTVLSVRISWATY